MLFIMNYLPANVFGKNDLVLFSLRLIPSHSIIPAHSDFYSRVKLLLFNDSLFTFNGLLPL